MSFDTPKTIAMRKFLETERGTGRVVGLSIEPDGVFIYTESAKWCDDAGSGTFRGDTETDAIRRFRQRVQRAPEPCATASRTIAFTMTWRDAAQIIAAALENGTGEGREAARAELFRMADILDQLAAQQAEDGRSGH